MDEFLSVVFHRRSEYSSEAREKGKPRDRNDLWGPQMQNHPTWHDHQDLQVHNRKDYID